MEECIMEPIFDKLYQFTYKIPGMPLDCHQYLLLRDPAILFSVGSADMARDFLPKVKELLVGRPLKYLFISHREWMNVADWPYCTRCSRKR